MGNANINYGSKWCLNPKPISEDGVITMCQFCKRDSTNSMFVDNFHTCAYYHCESIECIDKTKASLENWKKHRDANALLKGKPTFCVQRSSGKIDDGWQFSDTTNSDSDLNRKDCILCTKGTQEQNCSLASLLYAYQPISN